MFWVGLHRKKKRGAHRGELRGKVGLKMFSPKKKKKKPKKRQQVSVGFLLRETRPSLGHLVIEEA